MGCYLNPVSETFKISLRSPIYVDKSGLIAEMNAVIGTEQRFICVSRPEDLENPWHSTCLRLIMDVKKIQVSCLKT